MKRSPGTVGETFLSHMDLGWFPRDPKGNSILLSNHPLLLVAVGGGLLKAELFDADSELLLDSPGLGTGTYTSS